VLELATLQFTSDELRRAIEDTDLSSSSPATCEQFAFSFGTKATDEADGHAHAFLTTICSWRLRADDADEPFVFVWKTSRLEHLTVEQCDSLASIAEDIADPELHSRVADLLWLVRRDHRMGRRAVTDYLASAERLVTVGEILGVKERLNRAVGVAAQLGHKAGLTKIAVERISAIASLPDLPSCTVASCLETLTGLRPPHAATLYALSVSHAKATSTAGKDPAVWPRKFWELAAAFAATTKDKDAQRSAMIEVARTYEADARHAHMKAVAAHFWAKALFVYREIAGTEDERARVHKEMLDAQKEMRGEMFTLASGSMDLTQLAASAQNRVRGKKKLHALAELIEGGQIMPKASARDQAASTIESYPLQQLFSKMQLGSTGKYAAVAEAAGVGNTEIPEQALTAEAFQHLKYFVPVIAAGILEPLRHEVVTSHNVCRDDIAAFVMRSPFVPYGRETLFTIGLHAGLHGRFVEALHVLIPQVEHMIRSLLDERGVVTSSLSSDGLQEEFDLNRLLGMSATRSLLGDDIHFTLTALLVSRHGYNLRNEIAHGMVPPEALFSNHSVYCWWLIFWMVASPVARHILSPDEHASSESNQPGTES